MSEKISIEGRHLSNRPQNDWKTDFNESIHGEKQTPFFVALMIHRIHDIYGISLQEILIHSATIFLGQSKIEMTTHVHELASNEGVAAMPEQKRACSEAL